MQHPMRKEHYLSFMDYVTPDGVQMIKLYPDQEAWARFVRRGGGILYLYCNRHGLYGKKV
ncbi:MAG: desulfoferrodoxin family protein [Lachnospiraceae bacterium]|nr:desulfoferrodoxin family protein [Lachnospiraceae bacterium]